MKRPKIQLILESKHKTPSINVLFYQHLTQKSNHITLQEKLHAQKGWKRNKRDFTQNYLAQTLLFTAESHCLAMRQDIRFTTYDAIYNGSFLHFTYLAAEAGRKLWAQREDEVVST